LIFRPEKKVLYTYRPGEGLQKDRPIKINVYALCRLVEGLGKLGLMRKKPAEKGF
jgi:hypothetical protein